MTADAGMEQVTIALSEIVVEGASRAPERIVEAPAAISVVPPEVLQNTSITGQAPMALQTVPGVDVVQSGVNDFNVNARGFNSSLNRRVLVLQDGRDLAIAFLGSQEWNGMTQPLEDLGKVEMVRGPGSALYGANAFSGVLNITTPTAREVLGTKLTVGGGELETFRGDLRHASVFANDRLGLRINAGYNRSDTYSRSRTLADGTSLQKEYAEATDEPVQLTREVVPLFGQTEDPVTGEALGDRDPLKNAYGSGRLDYYLDNGSVLSVDGGASQVQNEIFVTGIGRVQVLKAIKPYARVAMAADRYNIFAYWNSRTSIDPQVSLQSGLNLEERSDIFHLEGQTNWNFKGDRGRVVGGASVRNTQENTSGTLMNLANDDRSDNQGSVYGQVEYKVVPQVRVVGAARVDDGDLFDTNSAQGRRGVQPQRESLVPVLGQPARSRRRTTRSSSSRFRWRRRTPPRPSSRAESRQYYAALQPEPSAAGARRAHHHRRSAVELLCDHPGAGAGQRRSQGREGDRLGVRL